MFYDVRCVLLALSVFVLTANLCCAKTQWILKNGVKFEGEEISRTQTSVTIYLPYGKLEFDNAQITSVKIIDRRRRYNGAEI